MARESIAPVAERMYSLADYLWMLADDTRVSAYAAAIRAVVRPGDRVLDLGAGFGFFSAVAARAGASRVEAVDTNPAIHLGPRLAAANGCGDRIVFHHVDVENLHLADRVDVVISDLRGPTPFARRSLATLIDVRRRLLRPGGAIVPLADTLFVAPCRVPEAVRRDVRAAFGREAVDTAPVERVVHDTPYRCAIEANELIAPGRPWLRVDYATVTNTDARGGADWIVEANATVAGFAVWFATELTKDIGFSSEPGSRTRVYRQIFIPLREALNIKAGERIRVELTLRLVVDDYIWAWTVWVTPADSAVEREVLKQNSIAETIVDPELLRRRLDASPPRLGATSAALLWLLSRIDGRATPSELAVALHRQSPQLFPSAASASVFVEEWTARMAEADAGILPPRRDV